MLFTQKVVTQVIVGYPGNSDHKASIMSISDECYSRNGYTGNSGYHKLQ